MTDTPVKPAPTITAIARSAGVSHATVSLVLNNRALEMQVNAQTAERVRRIAREMNYVPNPLARGMRGKRTQSIGVLWSLCGPHPAEGAARRITLLAQQRGFSTSLADSLNDPQVICAGLTDFARRRVDGVIVLIGFPPLLENPDIRRLLGQFKAAVVVLRDKLQTDFDQVFHDSDIAFEQIVGHLARTGRRRLAYLNSLPACQGKLDVIRLHMARHGYDPSQLTAIDCGRDVNPRNAPAILEAAAAHGATYDALICVNDEMAAAAMSWLRSRGKVVPDDVAVVGFNNSELSEYLSPALASVQRHDQAVADAAGRLLFNRLDDPSRARQTEAIVMDFVCRPSAGPSAT